MEKNMNIEFISYTGKYPCLCSGILTLRINGENYTFGYPSIFEKSASCDFPQFWEPGGSVDFSREEIEKGEWTICDDSMGLIEKHFGEGFLEKAIKIFNENVEKGCCGGCV